jgi:hypothetical protein
MSACQRRKIAVCLTTILVLGGCTDLPSGPASGGQKPVRGITLVDWTPGGYASTSAQTAISEIAATGATHVVLIATYYQPSANGGFPEIDPGRTPQLAALATAMGWIKNAGMAVVIKPHVDLDSGEWRGTISARDSDTWFQAYGTHVITLADLCETEGAAGLVIGTELAGTLDEEDKWVELIANVRGAFAGEVTYAASWDEAHLVPFWKDLDAVGVDFYGPVSTRAESGRMDFLVGWQRWLEQLKQLHSKSGRPILLTEIGYRSIDGAGLRPYDFTVSGAIDLGEQADLYWAAIEATGAQDWIEGMYWWNWPTDGSGGSDNGDYSPNDKPAEAIISEAWR